MKMLTHLLSALLLVSALGCGDDDGEVLDASTEPTDAGEGDTDAGEGVDAGAIVPGGPCSFNRECIAAERCECTEEAGCMCQPGERGTGQNGVDVCTSGNDCTSSVCVEGNDAMSYCSDECVDETDCTGMLPRCLDILGVGRICVPPEA